MLSRSAITLRIEAGDRVRGRRWDRVREPTGSPEVRNASTKWRKTSRGRSPRAEVIRRADRESKAKPMLQNDYPTSLPASWTPVGRRAAKPLGNRPDLQLQDSTCHAP